MKLLEKILFAVDVNNDSIDQLKSILKIAKICDSKIFIMYVIPDEGMEHSIKQAVFNYATESLHYINAELQKAGVEINEPIIEYGKPVDRILKMAAYEDINLILAGAGCKIENEKSKRGSTVAELIRQSEIPVWVIKSGEENQMSNILCPVDFSEPSKSALNSAILLSKFFVVNLTILGIYEPYASLSPELNLDIAKLDRKRLEEFKSDMDEFINRFDLKGINYQIEIKSGTPHATILNTIDEEGHDLLIMGTHGRSGISRFLMGSVTEKVTRDVPCSFITTKTKVVIKLKIDNEVDEITQLEKQFKKANSFIVSKSYKEAIGKYLICLEINGLHIPSMFKLAKVFNIIGDHSNADYYRNRAENVLKRLWDDKVGKEIAQYYLPENLESTSNYQEDHNR